MMMKAKNFNFAIYVWRCKMKRLVLFILVSVLGLCNSALANSYGYTVGNVICKNEADSWMFEKIELMKKEWDKSPFVCKFNHKTLKEDCMVSIKDFSESAFKGLAKEIEEITEKRINKYHQDLFDKGLCKVFDKDLKDITPRTKDISKEEVKEVKVKEDFDE